MNFRRCLVSSLWTAALVPAALAQPVARDATKASPRPRIVRIDGKDVRTSMGPAGDAPSGPGTSALLTGPSPAVLMDGWSLRTTTIGIAEDYDFTATDDVQLTIFAKLPETAVGGSGGESFDFVLVPCGTSTIPPRQHQVLFIDDVHFAPIGPTTNPHTFFFSITLSAAQIGQVFPPGSCVDWFCAVDFDATDNPDTDGNGLPDTGIELRPTRFLQLSAPTVDALGADVLRLFASRTGALDVYEPHPPSPTSKAVGAKPGEDASTRPWCFRIR